MSVYMGTTKIPTEKTSAEIMRVLTYSGANKIMLSFDPETREAVGVNFALEHSGRELVFALPIRCEGVLKQLCRKREVTEVMEQQARRTAWRQILRWVEAQVALIESEIVEAKEVFMPYLLVDGEKTLYESFKVNDKILRISNNGN